MAIERSSPLTCVKLNGKLSNSTVGYARQPPVAHVQINAKLVKMPERTIIAAFKSERSIEAAGTDMIDVVYAFDEALGKVLRSIVEWALRAPPD